MKNHRKFKSNYQDSFENYLDSNFAQSNNNNNNNDWDELLNDTIVKKNNVNEELKKELKN